MSSLIISGWKEEDCRIELKEIIDTFGDMTIEGMNKMDSTDIQSALSGVSLMYVTNFESGYSSHYKDNPDIKKEAFKVGEILEYVQQRGFWYARNQLETAMSAEHDDEEHLVFASEQILDFYYNLFDEKGFKTCRFMASTWNSKFGNVTYFPNLKIECYEDRSMLQALVLANEIINSPYDFLDCASLALVHGFDSVSDYLTFLAEENFEEYMKRQLNKDIFIDYRVPNEQIIELLK